MKRNELPLNDGKNNADTQKNSTRVYFFVALGALIAAAAAFGCSFIPNVGIYLLIVSVLLELASLSFLSVQKKKNNFNGVFALTVAAYILLGLSIALFVGGLIYVAVKGG